jgi:hypothetical protein
MDGLVVFTPALWVQRTTPHEIDDIAASDLIELSVSLEQSKTCCLPLPVDQPGHHRKIMLAVHVCYSAKTWQEMSIKHSGSIPRCRMPVEKITQRRSYATLGNLFKASCGYTAATSRGLDFGLT